MSYFDKQLREKERKEREFMEESMGMIAGAILGRHVDFSNEHGFENRSAVNRILLYFGMKQFTDEIPKVVEGTENQLDYILRPKGVAYRPVRLENGWYKDAVGPMLGTLKENGKVVALIPDKFFGYRMYVAETGKEVKINRKTDQLIENKAYLFYRPFPLKELKTIDLITYMLKQLSISDIVLYLLIMLITTLLGMLTPVFNKWLFGDVLESNGQVLLSLAAFMVSFSISNALIGVYQSFIGQRVSIKTSFAVQAAVMQRVILLPARFFKDYSSGELSSRSGYVEQLCNSLIQVLGNTSISALFSLIYIGQIFAYAPVLVIPSLCITLVSVLFSLLVTFRQMSYSKKQMEESSKMSGMSYSMITGMQKIKLAGAENRMFARWAKQYSKQLNLEYNKPMFLRLSGVVNLAITLLGNVLLYYLAIENGVFVSDYYAFNSAYAMVSGAFSAFASIAMTVANIRPILQMAKPIMENAPELSENKQFVTELSGDIELNNIYFRYAEDQPDIIQGLSLHIHPGEYLAIVGTTGCGKSTLMRLMLGFETPQKGSIFFDGKDITSLDLESLRRKIGTVLQDGKLFLGDIYSNIVITAPELAVSDAWEAAKIASIDEDIERMPMGMQTLISEGQGGISGGQKQRLMIARAVAPKPNVLLFDEATSALDNITQKKVSAAIDNLNCTRIVIAHRLSTIKHCDRIIVLDKGNIVESGTFEELIHQDSLFAELVNRQRIEFEEEE